MTNTNKELIQEINDLKAQLKVKQEILDNYRINTACFTFLMFICIILFYLMQ